MAAIAGVNYTPINGITAPSLSGGPGQVQQPTGGFSSATYPNYTPMGQVLGTQTNYSSNPVAYTANGAPYTPAVPASQLPSSPKSAPAPQQGQTPSGPDLSQIDKEYQDTQNMLNDQYNQFAQGQDQYINSYTQPYDTMYTSENQAYNQGLNNNQQQGNQVQQQGASAMDSARSLFNQLQRGAQQRFGNQGVGSIGDYVGSSYGKDLLKNLTGTQNQVGQNMFELSNQKKQIDDTHATNMQKIDQAKITAANQAKMDFQNRLDQINQQKNVLSQNKANAKLGLLQEYRNNVQNIANWAAQAQAQATGNYQSLIENLQQQLQSASSPLTLNSPTQWTPNQMGTGASNVNQPMITGNAGYDVYGRKIQQ